MSIQLIGAAIVILSVFTLVGGLVWIKNHT